MNLTEICKEWNTNKDLDIDDFVEYEKKEKLPLKQKLNRDEKDYSSNSSSVSRKKTSQF